MVKHQLDIEYPSYMHADPKCPSNIIYKYLYASCIDCMIHIHQGSVHMIDNDQRILFNTPIRLIVFDQLAYEEFINRYEPVDGLEYHLRKHDGIFYPGNLPTPNIERIQSLCNIVSNPIHGFINMVNGQYVIDTVSSSVSRKLVQSEYIYIKYPFIRYKPSPCKHEMLMSIITSTYRTIFRNKPMKYDDIIIFI